MKPFLKWAGGKTQHLESITKYMPKEIDTYYEPFVGAGAIFFGLASKNSFKKAVISIYTKYRFCKSIITKFYRKTDFDSIVDISKAENKLGFKPKTCLDEGLKYEIEWHKKTNDTKMVN